jgi:5'(3')-deoxyribonucleotidase
MKQTVYLDMDGTIYPLYEQTNWLARLRAEDSTVFNADETMITESELYKHFPKDKYEIKIFSMTPLGATKQYADEVIKVKNEWLDRHFPTLKSRIYRAYGHSKNLRNSKTAILVDDSETIRANFNGKAINPKELWG